MRILYFAHIRETLGTESESHNLPGDVVTISDCLDWLCRADAKYAAVFADRTKLRFALDQQLCRADTAMIGAQELAIFPPVTGG
jgi:sulfur-carrier protein